MNSLLQDAINATKAGNKKEAQLLLAQNLKENPDDVQSWYLLSMLVDSKEKQALYLSKTLALDPQHEKANERLDIMRYASEAAANITISEDDGDFINQAEGDTLPEWLAADADSLQLEKTRPVSEVEEEVEEVAPDAADAEQVPQWLQENVSESWVIQEPPTQISEGEPAAQAAATAVATDAEPEKPAPKKKRKPKKVRSKQEEKYRLNWILVGLILGLIIVFIALVAYAF